MTQADVFVITQINKWNNKTANYLPFLIT